MSRVRARSHYNKKKLARVESVGSAKNLRVALPKIQSILSLDNSSGNIPAQSRRYVYDVHPCCKHMHNDKVPAS